MNAEILGIHSSDYEDYLHMTPCSLVHAYQHFRGRMLVCTDKLHSKGKSVPLEAWSDPEGSRKLRFPDFMTPAQESSKVVSLTHWPPLPPGNTAGTHFC